MKRLLTVAVKIAPGNWQRSLRETIERHDIRFVPSPNMVDAKTNRNRSKWLLPGWTINVASSVSGLGTALRMAGTFKDGVTKQHLLGCYGRTTKSAPIANDALTDNKVCSNGKIRVAVQHST
ncbi:hypothetical protein [Paraburkholderia phytofirmans]|uniref:hypothetical protein n=1 Tax=Paraburkholderia phytofirmans TaxID=261302 RepID=UPI0011E06B2A|nr:hypothetical protein [Paraburkholderia phytofirmans]